MIFDFFLWPILIPMILPLAYCIKYKKESLKEVASIILIMIIIVLVYWPLTTLLITTSNILVKFLLFILLPLFVLSIVKRNTTPFHFNQYGLNKQGLKKSVILGLLFTPIMLSTTFIIKYITGINTEPNTIVGIISFIESFSEEFFFRGILFLLIVTKTNLKIAYITSFTSFVLMHPQQFIDVFIISTIVQGILTVETCRKTKNLTGAWLVHGTNRFFTIAIIPIFL